MSSESDIGGHTALQARLAAYMPTLDGLRGLAILLVIVHNLGIPSLISDEPVAVKLARLFTNAGWIGVQLFFVLSGFLITGILLDEKESKLVAPLRQLASFHLRRMLRIFPLYYFSLIAAFLIVPLFVDHVPWLDGAREHAIWYWLFASNWGYAWHDLGGGFAHFWSLAVEEQYYLVWPLVVIFTPKHLLFRVCVAMILIAASFRIALILVAPEFAERAAYTFTVARLDALGIGALLALLVRQPGGLDWLNRVALPFFLCGMLLVVVISGLTHNFAPVVLIESTRDWMGCLNQTIAALLSAALLYLSLLPQGLNNPAMRVSRLTNNLFGAGAIRNIGKYSFAIYVFHMPVINVWHDCAARLIERLYPNALLVALVNAVAVFTISYVLAWLSWRLIEKHFLMLKHRLAPRVVAS